MIGFIKRLFAKSDKHYVSQIDIFLNEVRANTPLSAAQRQEIAKHKRIAQLRDKLQPIKTDSKLWKSF